MKQTIITISREFGSGGHFIGEEVSKRLGIPFYDKNIIQQIAEKTGFSEDFVKEQSEYAPSKNMFAYAFVGRDHTGSSLSDQVYAAQTQVIRNLAEKGSCIIIGRCADYALAEDPNLLSLFISAPLEDRIARVAKRQKVTPEEAKSLIQKTDKRRASYCEYYASKKWGAVDGYDFCLNSSSLGLGGTVELIRSMVDQKEHPIPSPTEEDPTLKEV